jgi:hypothetical protein
MPRHDLQPMPGRYQESSGGEITPLQLSSWIRLWSILLAPVESQGASMVDASEAKPETATPLRRPPKRHDANKSIRSRSQDTKPPSRHHHNRSHPR